MPQPTLCYYVTGHGYGHAIRAAQVIKSLPPDTKVIVKSTVPPTLFRQEAPAHDLTLFDDAFDCGSVQSDGLTCLPAESLALYARIAAQNAARLAEEVAFLRDHAVNCVVTDIPSFPLLVAWEAGVPSVAVANFTWYDIYRHYAEQSDDIALLARMASEYSCATTALITDLAYAGVREPFAHIEKISLITRRGVSRRADLVAHYAHMRDKPLALLYFGTWGLTIDWNRVRQIRDWQFLTYDRLPIEADNITLLTAGDWRYADIAASVDAIVGKTGYGTVSQCIAEGVPLVYAPRVNFAEHEALVAGMARWGGGIPLETHPFLAGEWDTVLGDALSATLDNSSFSFDGAQMAAGVILSICE